MGYYRAGGALTDALVATLRPLTQDSPFGGTGPVQAVAQDAIDALTGKKQSDLGPKAYEPPKVGPAYSGRADAARHGVKFHTPGPGYVRHRMNVGNVRALRRSMRRIQQFAKLAHKTISFTHRTKLRKGRRR